MIESMETQITAICQDFQAASDWGLWVDTDIYLVNFFEYEAGTAVWDVRQDGYAYVYGLSVELDPVINEYIAISSKGYDVANINGLVTNDPDRVQFDSQTRNAIKHYQCTESGLKSV